MCGIAGFIDYRHRLSEPAEEVRRMADAIWLRGPDDSDIWCDEVAGVALGHRRLAIIDTSAAGRQPMHSHSRRYVMAFNGEIYNFAELRRELESTTQFNGHSDTEVLLAGVDTWGLQRTLEKSIGMFAIALWDKERRELWLARDRFGEKPLYYGIIDGAFCFASELKALRALSSFRPELDECAASQYMAYGYVPEPLSIYRGIAKLEPGCILRQQGEADQKILRYWDAVQVHQRCQETQLHLSDAEAIEQLDTHLQRSIGRCMVADVPLGAFLSGGIDSSTVVAIMQAQSSRPVKTFTIGFSAAEYNEAHLAAAVARHLGTEHFELYVQPADALAVVPLLPSMYDEPFADVSQIPTYLVSRLAREHVTVTLSGDAGDELFGGYNRYFWGNRLSAGIKRWPRGLRTALASAMRGIDAGLWNQAFKLAGKFKPALARQLTAGDRMHKLASLLLASEPADLYLRLTAPGIGIVEDRATAAVTGWSARVPRTPKDSAGFVNWMMLADALSYLVDDVLVKLDRASMSVSLESRVPLLDHELVQFAWRLPLESKIRAGTGKWVLRQVLERYVPRSLYDRPKMGFAVPLDHWLRGPLRGWASDLINDLSQARQGVVDCKAVELAWKQHLSGKRQNQSALWNVLMFQAWRKSAAV